MSNNLGVATVLQNQDNKEATINTIIGAHDAAITESLDFDLTSGNLTVSTTAYKSAIRYRVIGTGSARTLTLQAIKRLIFIQNASSNSISVVLGTTSISLAAGISGVFYTDGTTNGLSNLLFTSGGGGGGTGTVAQPSVQRWRIFALASQSGTFCSMAELQFRIAAGVNETTSGGTAVAGSEFSGTGVAANAFDSNASTRWAAETNGIANGTAWLYYNYAVARNVAEIMIQAPAGNQTETPTWFALEYWDGSAWQRWQVFTTPATWATGEIRLFTVSQFALRALADVDFSTYPVDKQALRFNAATGKFVPYNWTVSTQTGSYTAALTDSGTTVRMNSASALNFTVPADSTVLFPIGTEIEIGQVGAGTLTVVAASGVTINSVAGALAFSAQYQYGRLRKVAANTWALNMFAGGAGGGGGTSLAGLTTDVAISSPTNNQVLTYDSTAGKWKNATGSATSGKGAIFSPPLASRFPSSISGGAVAPTLSDDGDFGLVYTFGAAVSGDISRPVYKNVTAGSDWVATCRMIPNILHSSFMNWGIYVWKNGQSTITSFNYNTSNTSFNFAINKWTASGTGFGSSPSSFTFNTTSDGIAYQWIRVVYTNSTDAVDVYISSNGAHWYKAFSSTGTTLFGGVPDRLGLGMSINAANSALICGVTVPYWSDNAP